jgi:hypothetical protein
VRFSALLPGLGEGDCCATAVQLRASPANREAEKVSFSRFLPVGKKAEKSAILPEATMFMKKTSI